MFSGHMLGILVPVLMIIHYGDECLVQNGYLSPVGLRVLVSFLFIMVVVQAILILTMRNHYTSDIVVSCYLTPLLWNYYVDVIYPTDVVPPQVSEFEVVEREETRRRDLESMLATAFSPTWD